MDLEEFEEEIEQDKYMRKHINLYRDEEAIKARDQRRAKKQEQKEKPKDDDMKDENQNKEGDDSDWETDSEDYTEQNKEMVHLEELFNDMALADKDDEALDDEIDQLLGDMENIKIKK